MRARIDVSEIEAQTKIRAKYLRALENEEWGLLPGPTFVKSFLRTYAQALGLDGKALVEEYRLHHERGAEVFEPIVSSPRSRAGRPTRTGPSRAYLAAVTVIGALIVLLVVLLIGGGSAGSPKRAAPGSASAGEAPSATPTRTVTASRTPPARIIALSLKPTAAVYVCLIGDHGRRLISGVELQPGASTPTFHARRFQITLGNSSLTMFIDGHARTLPPSSEPFGYTITKSRGRQPLPSAQLPTCR